MQIFPLTFEDVEPMVEMAAAMHAEGKGYVGIPYEPDAMRTWFFQAMEQPDLVFCRVLKTDDGEFAGGHLGARGPFPFSGQFLAFEIAVYIYPQFRGGFSSVRLIKAFEDWARENNCIRAQAGASIDINDDIAIGIYERLGYYNAGPVLRKEL